MEDTNIWTACGDGQFEIVKAFVAGGISVNAQDDYGYSPLHAACSYRNSEIATWLLSQGARVDLKDSDGETALMVCEDPVCADLLLAAGADIFHISSEGKTAYHVAIWEHRDEMVQWLKDQYAQRGVALPEVGDDPEKENEDDDEEEGFMGDDDNDDGGMMMSNEDDIKNQD
jgi:ankyrin repeat protein